MYKKIEKSSKICLCMIKKTSSRPPPHTKKNPPKNKIAPKQSKKRKRMKKNPKQPEKF